MLITAGTVTKKLTSNLSKIILIAVIAVLLLLSFVLISFFVKKKEAKRCKVKDCKSLNYITSKRLPVYLIKSLLFVTISLLFDR